MQTPDVSIVVPVYNLEKWIDRCLDSIARQTFSNFEVLLIDDGSTDNSGAICDEYAKRDSRFHAYHKENGGLASANQYGLDRATGKYIINVDPDDWVEEEMLASLYSKAEENNADMVICDFYMDYPQKQIYKTQRPDSLEPDYIIDSFFSGKLHGSHCNKLIKLSCIRDGQVSFAEGANYCEDLLFNVKVLTHIKKVSYLHAAFYHYVQYASSLSYTNPTNSKWLKNFEIYQKEAERLAVEMNKPWIRDCVHTNKLMGMIRHGDIKNSEFKKELNRKDVQWVTKDMPFKNKILLNVAKYVSFSLSQRLYSFFMDTFRK